MTAKNGPFVCLLYVRYSQTISSFKRNVAYQQAKERLVVVIKSSFVSFIMLFILGICRGNIP